MVLKLSVTFFKNIFRHRHCQASLFAPYAKCWERQHFIQFSTNVFNSFQHFNSDFLSTSAFQKMAIIWGDFVDILRPKFFPLKSLELLKIINRKLTLYCHLINNLLCHLSIIWLYLWRCANGWCTVVTTLHN